MYDGPQNNYESLLDGRYDSGCATKSNGVGYVWASFDKVTKINYILVTLPEYILLKKIYQKNFSNSQKVLII